MSTLLIDGLASPFIITGGMESSAASFVGSIITRGLGTPFIITNGYGVGLAAGIEYRIYANSGAGDPIDYTTIVDSVAALTWESDALTFPGVWKFGIRTYNTATSLEEKNIDAVVTIRLDAAGLDITRIPDAPIGLTATPGTNGTMRLDFHSRISDNSRIPAVFTAYKGTSGTPNYASAAGTTPFLRGVQAYSITLSGLTGGTAYTFGVRASNVVGGEEENTITVTRTAATTGPTAVMSLAGTAIS